MGKEIYDMRHTKMAEWMENVEKSISRIMADKVYTSAEFKRERDNFHALCKDLERAEVKKWLQGILEILMAERGKEERSEQGSKLDAIITKHEELIPLVMKTQVMVDLYWKCYAYGDELKPHIEFLDGIMLSSTRDIAPSCVENVDELIERQEKSLVQLETKRGVVKELIEKGKKILENPDKPKFLEGNVKKIQEGWEETKEKAAGRLKLLQDTKEAWIGYAENSETIASDFEYCEEEIKKVKKKYNLQAAQDDLKKRQDLYSAAQKKNVDKEIKAVSEKLEVAGRFGSAVKQIEDFVANLNAFDVALKSLNDWMVQATGELTAIRDAAGSMLPEDRVARSMDLQEDIASKLEVLKANTATEKELFPQGDKPPQDAQDYKDELNRITKYITDLEAQTRKECDAYSEDVKYWAEYRTGIKELNPWVAKDKTSEGENQFSLEKMESTLGELKNIFKAKEKLVEGL